MSDDQPLPPPIRGRMHQTFIGRESPLSAPVPDGIVVDGAVYGLGGQPPVARTAGWGDLSWQFYRLRG